MPKLKSSATAVRKPAEDTESMVANRSNKNLYVYAEKSITKNMGDFNSAKVTVGMTLPFNPTDEDIAQANASMVIVTEQVDKHITEQVINLLDAGEEAPAWTPGSNSKYKPRRKSN